MDRLSRHGLSVVLLSTLIAGCATFRGTASGSDSPTVMARATRCFDLKALSDSDRVVAEKTLLEFSDREGLYTLADGLKPMSSDVRNLQLRIAPTLDTVPLLELDRLRRVVATLTCGEIGMLVQVFTNAYKRPDSTTVRSASLAIYHRRALRDAIVRQKVFFGRLGVTPSAEPGDVLSAVENAPRADRWRGYGFLFGDPDDAVEFFVDAGVRGDSAKQLVPRDFRRVETFQKYPGGAGEQAQSSFVYAVPKGAALSAGDRRLLDAAAPLYRRYLTLRTRHIGADSLGAVALWREWYGQ